jgi:hypothetical protein
MSDQPPATVPEAAESSGNRFVPALPLTVSVVAVGLALYIGSQVIGVLYAIINPPSPPLPPQARLIESTSPAYGVDYNRFEIDAPACSIADFYDQLDEGYCVFAPGQCGGDLPTNDPLVARCYGEQTFSIFVMQWEAIVSVDAQAPDITYLNLSREIFWLGEGRQPADPDATLPAPRSTAS